MKGQSVQEAIDAALAAGAVTSRVNFAAATGGKSIDAIDLTEPEFQLKVISYAWERGWRVAHFRKVRVSRGKGTKQTTYWETPVSADGKGFPDLELVRERLIKMELKVGKNKRDAEQLKWADAYARAKVEYYCLYPRDWTTIVEVLK